MPTTTQDDPDPFDAIVDAPFDAALVDDARVMHGVTAVEPLQPDSSGFRDVLVVTFRHGGKRVHLVARKKLYK